MELMERSLEVQNIAKVPIGGTFEHYKGKRYRIFGIGRHSETLGMCVYYQSLYECAEYGDYAMWVRPLEIFLSTVTIDGQEMPRFRLIGTD